MTNLSASGHDNSKKLGMCLVLPGSGPGRRGLAPRGMDNSKKRQARRG
jgi:hypothetical protein